ncbi:MAG: response regulator [Polyangiaceae bacterium]|nr:response regulator [Polyangiaceae bacterium]
MATTILAVDDSVTMRKILEITFAGTDFNLVAVGSAEEAHAKVRGGGVGVIICDNSLEGDGYEVARGLKGAAPSTPILFLSSRQNPYDAAKGSGARVDDHIDKPFDTQQLIDRVNKLASGGVGVAAAAPAPAPVAAAPAASTSAQAKSRTMAYGAPPVQSAPAPAAAKPAGFGAGGLGGARPAAPAPAPAPAPVAQARSGSQSTQQGMQAPAATPPARPAVAVASAAVSAANGQLAAKVGEMGLTPQQADAILALSRDLIERVVWEVVPVLAESLIREEIGRLTK